MRSMFAPAIALASVTLFSGLAAANTIQIISHQPSSTEMIGKFTGTMTYTGSTLNTGLLTIVLTNTNTAAEGGYITGVVFNIPGSEPGSTSLLTGTTFPGFLDTGSIESAAPFGTYEAGAALGGSWLGGGSPTGGIGVGQTGTLTFAITRPGALGLTAESFLGTAQAPAPLVRFKGFANGGSDKVPAVPAPGAAALFGLGALAARRRRR